MNGHNDMEMLFEYARECNFRAFEEAFSQMEASLPPEAFWEAYLLRAQIKLYAADISALDDLIKAEAYGDVPSMPFLNALWPMDALNRITIFPKGMGALRSFLQALPSIMKKMTRWYGQQGTIMVRQIQKEVYYFMGCLHEALDLAETQHRAEPKSPTAAMISLILQYRCNLALGRIRQTEQCMFDLIRCSKANPECVKIYKAFRAWATMTTGWNGDVPRFHQDANGEKQPVLGERLDGIRMGMARTTPVEMPFVEYAQSAYDNAYILRKYYMDWFHAIYWFSVQDFRQAEFYFKKAYEIAKTSDLVMPIVESGEQVVPLLRYMKERRTDCPAAWLDIMIARAERYEECLKALSSDERNDLFATSEGELQKGIKGKLFDKAIELFSLRGYENVSLNDIADAVGIMTTSAYNHYTCKADILEDIYTYYERHFFDNRMTTAQLQGVLATGTFKEIMRDVSWSFYGMPPEQHTRMTAITRIIYARFLIDDWANRFFCDVMLKENMDNIQQVLQALADMGRLRADFDSKSFAEVLNDVRVVTGIVGIADRYEGGIVDKKARLIDMLAELLEAQQRLTL